MGWQDRDYASDYRYTDPVSTYGRGLGRPRSVVSILIGVNVAVYLLCAFTAGRGPGLLGSPIFQFGAMTTQHVLHGQVWRLVTSDYLHWNTMHIFMNMLGLYFLGRPLEQLWGPRRFFVVYTVAGVLGSAFYMVLTLAGVLAPGIAAGASGCVLGLLGAAAVLFPHAEVYIWFLFPVKIRIVAVVLGGFYVLNVFQGGQNAGGDACHLAGLAFGVWWAMRGERWWNARRRWSRAASTRRVGFRERIEQRRRDAATIDDILDKVRAEGMASLSDHEKRTLEEATERQRRDERYYDRLG